MTTKYNVGSFGVTHAFPVKEGNLTMATTQGVGGEMIRPQLASPVTKGMGLKIAGDLLFAPCAAGDEPIGFAAADPNDWDVEPTADALDGAYPRRYCSIEFRGHKILTVKLEAANTAVTAGDPIKVGATTAGCYDKGTASNKIAIALEGATASSGAEIAVLFI
jgi:hypothetical protein